MLIPFLLSAISYQDPAPIVLPLWTGGAPGFENRRNEPELKKDWWVKNIHNPSLTVYLPPKGTANGALVVIAPGGGHRELVFDAEGRDAALFLNKLGVAAAVLKYRLAREEGSPYKLDVHMPQDAARAMRLARSKAAEWSIDPDRVGILGFSAGGEVVSAVAYRDGNGAPNAADAVDRLSSKPNYQMLVYPGPLFIPQEIPATAPPTFLVVSNDDGATNVVVALLQGLRKAKVPVEAHIFAMGNHAFNMGYRSEFASVKGWPSRMADWMQDRGYLKPK